MSGVRRWSERNQGGLTGEGMLNTLGRPGLDRIAVVIREAAQNAWDARLSRDGGEGPVPSMSFRLRELKPAEAEAFKEFFSDPAPTWTGDDEFTKAFKRRVSDQRPIRVLEISDRGTVGLRGPTDPRPPIGSAWPNFINFFFDVGKAHPDGRDGGTYGFGKSALYAASAMGMILVDTVVASGAGHERRMMGCRVGKAYEKRPLGGEGARFTGRHYWGRALVSGTATARSIDEVASPLLNEAAEGWAVRLGLSPRGLADTGTTVLIPWPVSSSEKGELSGARIVDLVMHNLWPKLLDKQGPRAMYFGVEENGVPIPLPGALEHPIYKYFAWALSSARERNLASGAIPVQLVKPKATTGHLACFPAEAVQTECSDDTADERAMFAEGPRHVACMRDTELVVTYKAYPSVRKDGEPWAAVFLVAPDPEFGAAFAEAEPPSHDDWAPEQIEDKTQKSLVKQTLKRIGDILRQRFSPMLPVVGEAKQPPLARAADAFSQRYLTGGGTAAAPSGGTGGGGTGTPSEASLSRPRFVSLRLEGERRIARFRVDVRRVKAEGVLSASPEILIDGAVDVPADIAKPRVVCWFDETGVSLGAEPPRVNGPGSFLIDVEFGDRYAVKLRCEVKCP